MWRSADPGCWTGRVDDTDGPRALRWHQRMRVWDEHVAPPNAVALIGFCSDEGVRRNHGRIGAAGGPRALRSALANIALHGTWPLFDAGDVLCEAGDLETAQQEFGGRVSRLLDAGAFVLALGGGHEIAWASFQGLAAHLRTVAPPRIGILNFDAHFDLRNAGAGSTSGTPFRQIAHYCAAHGQPFHYRVIGINRLANTVALYDVARDLDVQWIEDIDCGAAALPRLHAFIDALLESCDLLYMTVCLDVLHAAAAPGVSAPAAPGIDPALVIDLIRHCGVACRDKGVRWVLGEIAELNPLHDIDRRSARLGARIAHELVAAAIGDGNP